MGLAELQTALARLYTDESLRSRFFAEPEAIANELGLEIRETDMLRRLARSDVEAFARSLASKRLEELGELLPLTRRALDRRFSDLVTVYAANSDDAYPDRRFSDALSFAKFLESTRRQSERKVMWISELVRYEACWVRARIPGPLCLIRAFRHTSAAMAARACSGGEALAIQPTIAFWLRLSASNHLTYFSVSLPRWPSPVSSRC